jgi:Domain of unknown function (DUF2019)
MKRDDLSSTATDELVKRFAEYALQQADASLDDDVAKVNRLFWRLKDIEQALKDREGDQRSALLLLYNHPNAQVRVKAAKATLAVAPVQARAALQALADSKEYPPALEAGMSIDMLNRGIYKPT